MNHQLMGNQIRRLREQKAWTQEHLAAAAVISTRTIQRAEEGTMSAETLSAIAGALNIDIKEISNAIDIEPKMPTITPIVFFSKASTIDWLAKAFGFEIIERHLSPDGSIMHAELKIGVNGLLMCGSPMPSAGMKTPTELGGVSHCLNIIVKNVNAHFEKAKAAGAEIVSEPQDGYGYRRYLAKDPEGHLWYFATAVK